MESTLTQNLDKSYKVMGFVKPGAGMLMLVDTAKEEINSLTQDVMLILRECRNDVTINVSGRELTHNEFFLMRTQHTNVY